MKEELEFVMGCFRCTGSSSKKSENIEENHPNTFNSKTQKPDDRTSSGDFSEFLQESLEWGKSILFDPLDFEFFCFWNFGCGVPLFYGFFFFLFNLFFRWRN